MKKDKRTIYWNNDDRKEEEPYTWMGPGGSQKLLGIDKESGQAIIDRGYGPVMEDIRMPDVEAAARRATIASYVAQEKYPEASIKGREADWQDREQQFTQNAYTRDYEEQLARLNAPKRERPIPGTINGYPEDTFSTGPRVMPATTPAPAAGTAPPTPTVQAPRPAFTPLPKGEQITEEEKKKYSLPGSVLRNLWNPYPHMNAFGG